MAEVKKVTLKRFNGTDDDTLHPTTEWDQIESKPATFTPTAHSLNSHTDVDANPTADGQVLTWDAANNIWIASISAGGGGAVDSVNSQTGVVVLDAADVGAVDLTGDTMTGNLELPSLSIDGQSITWNDVNGTFDMGLLNDVVLQAGQEIHFYAKAQSAIANGDAVMFVGVEGDHMLIAPTTVAGIQFQPELFVGVATQAISQGAFGYVTWFGYVRDLDTVDRGWEVGNILYLDTNPLAADGAMTSTKPTAQYGIIQVAAVIKEETGGADNGTLLVRPKFVSRKISDITGLQDALDQKAIPTIIWLDGGTSFSVYNLTEPVIDGGGA